MLNSKISSEQNVNSKQTTHMALGNECEQDQLRTKIPGCLTNGTFCLFFILKITDNLLRMP